MNFIKKIETILRRQKMKNLLKNATEIIYTYETDLSLHLEKEFLQNKKGSDLLCSYFAIQTVASAKWAIDKSDIDNCLQEFDLSLSSANINLNHLIEHNKLKAEVILAKAEVDFALGKHAFEQNELSSKGTIYSVQKIKKGPLTFEEQKRFREMAIDIMQAQNALDKHNRLKENPK